MPRWVRPSLVLYDVTTLHFETDAGDGFREPGFSKERRLDPQITIGLLTDASGFPLTVEAFEGNKAETATMVPVINAFKTAHQLTDVTVVADAGMISEANQVALQAAGLSFILGARIPYLPDVVREWRDKHPDEAIPDRAGADPALAGDLVGEGPRDPGSASSTTSTATTGPGARCAGSTSRSPKPNVPSTGMPPVKRNRYIQLSGATKSVNRAVGGQDPRAGRLEGLHHQPRRPVRRRSSSAPTTSCGASRRRSGCPSTTCRPARSTTAPATPSTPT